MKKNTTLWVIAAILVAVLSSCLSNSNSYSNEARDCSITAFSIKDFETEYTTKDSDGQDSTYTVKTHAHEYSFTIDQIRHEIFNPDSLPAGVNVSKILCNVSSDGNVVFRDNNFDPTKPTSIEWRSINDSIDFRKPVTMRVWAYNGTDYRDYMVRLNIHRQNADSTQWVKSYFPGEDLQYPHAVTFGNKVAVYGLTGDGLMVTIATNGESDWSELHPVNGLGMIADYTAATSLADTAYITQEGKLYCSTDGINWTAVETNVPVLSLMGSNSTKLFASNGQQFFASADGTAWNEEDTEYANCVPTTFTSCANIPLNTLSKAERTILTGLQPLSTDSVTHVWYRQGNDSWALMHTALKNQYRLPNLTNLTMLHFKDALIAFGGYIQHAYYPGIAMATIYVSLDNGLTWKTQSDDKLNVYPTLPAALKGFDLGFAAYVDQNENIWILCSGTGDAWKGNMVKETILTPQEH